MNKAAILRFDHVGFVYPEGNPLFDDLCFELNEGGFYVVRGPSGSGKSTILRLLNRLENPSRGDIFFKDNPFSNLPTPELRRQILYIQQTPVVIDGTVKDNLLLPFTFKNNRTLPVPGDAQLKQTLSDFSLDQVSLDKSARNLSVGQQQRICLIRGLLLSPAVILLDEPTSALDDESSRIVEGMAETLCHDMGKTIVMVSHREFNPNRVKPVAIDVREGGVSILP